MAPGRKRLSSDRAAARLFEEDSEMELATVFVANVVAGSTERPHDGQERLLSLMSLLHAGHFAMQFQAASLTGREASVRRSRESVRLVSIHLGADSRSSSGRFMAKTAIRRFVSSSHHALKLVLLTSPRYTVSMAPVVSPQNSYERSNRSEKK